MMDRIWRSQREKDQGFSLVELLIVIIIMGILAAVAIPMFLSQREKAQDSATKSDVETLGKELVTWFVGETKPPAKIEYDKTGYYLLETTTTAKDQDSKVGNHSPNVYSTATGATPDAGTVTLLKASDGAATGDSKDWCVELTNDGGKLKTFAFSSTLGLITTGDGCVKPSGGGS